MSQRTAMETAPATGKSLHPVLQQALGSLDVYLDEELSRYRRQRAGQPMPPPPGLSRQPSRKPLDLITVPATGGRAANPTPAATGTMRSPGVSAPSQPSFQVPAGPVARSPQVPTELPPTPVSVPSPVVPPPVVSPSASAARVTAQPPVNASGVAVPPPVVPVTPVMPSNPSMPGVAATPSPVSLSEETALSVVSGQLVVQQREPDDYLESSEALLRSLSEAEDLDAAIAEPDKTSGGFTPLRAGALVLFLLASALSGYIVMNPASLKHWNLQRFVPQLATTPTTSAGAGTSSPSPAAESLPKSPNLTSQEFVDLNLETLGTIKPGVPNRAVAPVSLPSGSPTTVISPSASPSAIATPAAPATVSNPLPPGLQPVAVQANPEPRSSAQPEQKPAPRPAPQPVAAKPAPMPVVVKPIPVTLPPVPVNPPSPAKASAPGVMPQVVVPAAPSVAAAPSASSYSVVTDYQSDRNLEAVKKVVPDAYVRNFPAGARIQLGSFQDAARAKVLVQQLQEQGIPAQVYSP